ncbi:MAG: BatD family protein [Mariniblastus sp.]
MRTKLPIYKLTVFAFLAFVTLFVSTEQVAFAQKVEVRISSREAFVGVPLVLEVVIRNAEKYDMPELPEIKGCEIESAGTPSRSSRITIINGRRSESQSVTMRYLITAREPGTFEIPEFEIVVDGKRKGVKPIRFVATKSETGDLLFVEIKGGKDKVYVGEELDLTLKIWLKPFRDRGKKITLSEGNMWQMVSERSSWGSFGKTLQEMSDNNQRPAGKEVLRVDEDGEERAYYLYTIEAKAYPTLPGKINADDVQVMVSYPSALGRSRDPFDSMFNRGRLTVTAARPIVAEAQVDSTEVLPIPTVGRPDDYRGAVGTYALDIVAKGQEFSAGDLIALNIAIRGDGPMELVQAPPLSTLSNLTKDFKVSDQPLAGFVQGDTKYFSTSIRPRRAGITEIPSIPFSFFNPETESFRTVYSNPISIIVTESETLALDSIVGNSRSDSGASDDKGNVGGPGGPDFSNHLSDSVLKSQGRSSDMVWIALVVVPPLVWLVSFVVCRRESIAAVLPSLKSAKTRCRNEIDQASSYEQIVASLSRFVLKSFKQPNSKLATNKRANSHAAVGTLRTVGLQTVANELELFFSKCERGDFEFSGREFQEVQREAKYFTTKIETEFESSGKAARSRLKDRMSLQTSKKRASRVGRAAGMLLIALLAPASQPAIALGVGTSATVESQDVENIKGSGNTNLKLDLSTSQQKTIFTEANQAYLAAEESMKTDSVDAIDGFVVAAKKYQMLVDSGIRNSRLFANLANSYLQSGELGRAIANYHRAQLLDPANQQVKSNLQFAVSKIEGTVEPKNESTPGGFGLRNTISKIRDANDWLLGNVGRSVIVWALGIASVLFWGLLIARNFGLQIPVLRLVWFPLLVLAVALTSVLLDKNSIGNSQLGIVVSKQLTLRSGAGGHFEALSEIETAEGQAVKVLGRQADWMQVKSASGQVGWVPAKQIENVDM